MYLRTIIVTLAIFADAMSAKELLLDIAVSAKTHKIQLLWENLDVNGTILLRNAAGSEDLVKHVIKTPNGWIDTELIHNYTHFRDVITTTTSCYGYFAYYFNTASSIIPATSTCMMAYPRWMSQQRVFIGPLRFREIFLPGSHDAAAYKSDFDPETSENIVNKYVLTQDEDIRGQLYAGIRYLDIRPAYYPNSKDIFWVNHGVSRVQPMEQVLKDVSDFVTQTDEIVILDFHQFPVGFSSYEIHKMLVEFVKERIGDKIVQLSTGWESSLNDIWTKTSQRIILGYGDDQTVTNHFPFAWQAIQHRWADVDNVEKLKSYLYNVNDEPQNGWKPVSDMAQMTPTTNGVVIDKYKGLRKMADTSNPLVSEWYRHDLGQKANIVSLEFLRGTTVIKDCLKMNVDRRSKSSQ